MRGKTGELALIERIRAGWGSERGPSPKRSRRVVLGIGDDCAILRPPRGHEILVTTDFTLESRHFRRDWHSAESAGHRALARGLSDLAAMGAEPLGAFLSLALPPELVADRKGQRWLEGFFTGLRALADRSGVELAGGDTSESPCSLVLADIMLVGSAPAGRALRRSGAKPGDLLYVTGSLGGAAAELAQMISGEAKRPAPRKSVKPGAYPQSFPEPRLAVGKALLARRLASAAIDLSDGLSTDLAHLCDESRVGAEIEEAALPIHPLAQKFAGSSAHALDLALNGGEDYELLFTARAAIRMPRSIAGVAITRIGCITRKPGISLIDENGKHRALTARGWEHFAPKR